MRADSRLHSARSAPGRDEVLVREFNHGAPGAFEAIYKTYRGRVERICRRYVFDIRDVEEAVQDTFVKAARALPRFNGQFYLGAWLGRIATNSAIDHARRQSRRREIATSFDERLGSRSVPVQPVATQGATVHDTLAQLRTDHALALQLKALDGASYNEIADALGKSPQQVKGLLHRARVAFRKRWENV